MGHENRGRLRQAAAVAIVGEDGVDAVFDSKLGDPLALDFHVGQKRRDLQRNAKEISSLGVGDVGSWLGVKSDVLIVEVRL